jgi:hypothetical protein
MDCVIIDPESHCQVSADGVLQPRVGVEPPADVGADRPPRQLLIAFDLRERNARSTHEKEEPVSRIDHLIRSGGENCVVHLANVAEPLRQPSGFCDDSPAALLVRGLGLETRGPYRLSPLVEEPSDQAWQLAAKLTRQAIDRHPATPLREVNEELLWAAVRVGLPLTAVFAPDAFFDARDRLVAARMANNQNHRTAVEAELPTFIRIEDALWRLAGSEIPYAVRFALVEWFRPRTDESQLPGICLRCGVVETRRIWTAHKREPRCDACRRRRREDRNRRPPNAIAYAARGTWWLRCQRAPCTLAFEARGQARNCPEHTTSKLTASQRPRSIPLH